ncbi:DUF2817 domain-containing protein [Candidatus Saccharibacteria bacterium]|nr:DUF2817 domain-containing protein [Candidatus Saccharibacteria bacterium]
MKKIFKKLWSLIRAIPLKIRLITIVLIVLASYGVVFFIPQSVVFAYDRNEYCASRITFLPNIHEQSGGNGFQLSASGGVKFGDFYLFSDNTCIKPVAAPVGSEKVTIGYSPFGSPLFKSEYSVTVAGSPSVTSLANRSIAQARTITFNLDKNDKIFSYVMAINDRQVDCDVAIEKISCDVSSAALKQGQEYDYQLIRYFDSKKVSTVISGSISLLPPVVVSSTSVNNNDIVYSKPRSFTFEVNKSLASAKATLEKIDNGSSSAVISTVTVSNKTVTLSIASDLERQKTYRLTLKEAAASDGSYLDQACVIDFTTSAGPTVKSVSVGSGSVSSNAKIIVTFDQNLASSQNVADYASLTGGSASISRYGDNGLAFQLNGLPTCGAFNLSIKKGLISAYGITSTVDWSYDSRVSCRRSSVIGYSVQGRPIYAYYYGSGSTTILFTGGIHGNEYSGEYMMQDWASYLDSNGYQVPADRQVVIVPNINPDGLATGSRYNAHNVNLDRNFPTTNWQTDIDTYSGYLAGGGGTSPLSEPEAQALADLTTSLMPRLEVSYHAAGSLLGANQYGDSVSIANQYASSVGYDTMIGNAEAVMGYSMTGEYEDWMGETYDIPAILIELPTASGHYFQSHLSTLWKMVRI